MTKEKSIQIPEKLFFELLRYFVMDSDDQTLRDSIKQGLINKIERSIDHDLYTKYKTAPTAEQRDAARQEYLERRGIPASFRW